MNTPIDSITFNILNMAEKFQDFFHGASADVEFKYIDDDGNIVTSVVPNVAKYIAHLDSISITSDELNTALANYKDATEVTNLLAGKLDNSSVLNTLTSDDATSPVSAKQAKVLKGLIDGLTALMASDDTSLDTIQELVTFVKTNKADLAALQVSNITGLQDVLDTKANADDVYNKIDIGAYNDFVVAMDTANN